MNYIKRSHIRLSAALMAAAMAFSLCACSEKNAVPANAGAPNAAAKGGPAKSTAINVNIAYPERETLSRQTDFAGKLEASQTVKVYPEVSGTVLKTYANAGDYVEKGQLLFEFDSEDAETDLKSAELSYQKTINGIESEESGSSKALTIMKYENAIESARLAYENARDDAELIDGDIDFSGFRRYRKAMQEAEEKYDADPSDTTWKDYCDALENYEDWLDEYTSYTRQRDTYVSLERAHDNYMQALDEYDVYKTMTQGENAANRDISRQQAEIALENAQKKLKNQKVYAPVSGIVAAKNINEYDTASTQTVAYTISQEGLLTVSFNLSEDGANAMDIGTPVTVVYNGKEYDAEVIELAPEASSTTGLYPTKAQLKSDIGTTRSGSVIKVRAITALEENTLTISLDHIYYDGNQPYVFVYDNGVARRVDVTVGMTTLDKVSITEGISDDDAIITTWHPKLADGAAVKNSELGGGSTENKGMEG